MSIINDKLPDYVLIDDKEYKINSNFRAMIEFELTMINDDLSEEDKLIKVLELFYYHCPQDIEKAINKMLWFYRCGKEDGDTNYKAGHKSERIYCFNHDADYIYSAYLSQYGIDLQEIEHLHWWKFKSLFKSLSDEHEFVKIMGYRAMDLSKIKDKEQKVHYQKLKNIHKLPVSKKEQYELDALTQALLKGEDISKIL